MNFNSPLIINFKNYLEIAGEKSIELSKVSEQVSDDTGVDIIIAPPPPSLSQVCAAVKTPVIGQHVDFSKPGSTTGFLVPEIVKSYGAVGSLLNHSEHRFDSTRLYQRGGQHLKKPPNGLDSLRQDAGGSRNSC